ncbi:MAG: polyprenyl synthetase family protein [Bacteroidales bacterium]|nr:polyprenyl synthetase family protein [Clostridium sp.]MCM1202641.1 polyprenyl synthetase family protein [Bacteroidales bacterium]
MEEKMTKRLEYTEAVIARYMPKEYQLQKTVIDAMQYTMSAGGKRIRPILMGAVYEFFGGSSRIVEPFMAALEMIHTYSLIHDDLPALDNDDYRRGRKTAHIVYGEAMAILAGDSLLNYAYETAAKAFSLIEKNDGQADSVLRELEERRLVEQAMAILAQKPGIYGMIGGQTADVELTGTRLNEEQLTYIYRNKTGALIEAAMMIGAVLAGASGEQIEKMEKAAYNVGMAFQIQDDILDETATFEELGKPIHSDEKNDKVTYVTLHGISEAEKEVKRLSDEAVEMVDALEGDAAFLTGFIRNLIHRKK